MKSSKIVVGWRPVMGVAMVGAMALSVSALAGPRGADGAVRGTAKTGTEVTRLVTGDPAQINAVVAGPAPTLILAVNPVDPPNGIAYPPGCAIIGNELRCDRTDGSKGGFRAFFHVQVSGWGVEMATYQVKIDCSGYYQSDCLDVKPNDRCHGGINDGLACPLGDIDCPGGACGLDLKPARQTCASNADCRAANATGFGESWVKCILGVCENGYLDNLGTGSPSPEAESWCEPNDGGCAAFGVATGTCHYNYFSVSDSLTPDGRTDNGELYYAGTLVLDIPAGAKGKYTVNLNTDGTFGAEPGTPPVPFESLAETGFVINIVGGSCCHNLGTPTAGCFDQCINRSDCEIEANRPFVFTPQKPGTCVGGTRDGKGCAVPADCPGGVCAEMVCAGGINDRKLCPATVPGGVDCTGGACTVAKFDPTCDNKPTADGCVECVVEGVDPLCDDNDACTTETCNATGGFCVRGFKAGFNPVKGGPGDTGNCCDSATGDLTDKDDGDDCTVDSCSIPAGNRGTAEHDPVAAAGLPCDDLNSCAVNDKCDGVRTYDEGGCLGTPVNGLPCDDNADCQFDGQAPTAVCQLDGTCFCTVTPKVTFKLEPGGPGGIMKGKKECVDSLGISCGVGCAKDSDCPSGCTCDNFFEGANCFWEGQKISALVHIGVAAEPINGGQLQINYDPSCVDLNSVVCLPPYVTEIYRAIDEGAGKIFIACGVDPFGKVDGPLGNVDMLALSFTMIGECNNCELCFESKNPQNSYLVDADGYKVIIEGQCKELSEFGDLVLNVPDNIKVNSDCDVPAADVAWDKPPSASFSCGDVNLTCRGAHQSGLSFSGLTCEGGLRNSRPCGTPANCPGGTCVDKVMNGGVLPQGQSSFCCYAWAKDKCDQDAGCPGAVNDCPETGLKPDGKMGREGCWTVEVSDETSMDIHIQLEPPMSPDSDGDTRCIEFCLYGDCLQGPTCFQENVLFDGLYNYIGKASGKIKVPKGKWACITAQDQLHSLRSCDNDVDCIDNQLVARFKGDPAYGGNWLIMGNLDGWKKNDPTQDPSLDVIDILDFGKFVAQYQVCYEDRKYGCHEGPHADINGDGCVTMDDYMFVLRNFMVSSKDCCCGPQAAALPPALTEVTIDQLREMGEEDLIVADLNGDGVLNAADMDAFTQGVRPTKSNDRRGGKGLRSGR